MEIKDFFNLMVPLVGVAGGIAVKVLDYEPTKGFKKYWWLIVLISFLSFILRFYRFINS